MLMIKIVVRINKWLHKMVVVILVTNIQKMARNIVVNQRMVK